jgi:hypothetical protein
MERIPYGLSDKAKAALDRIRTAAAPIPSQEFNPGIIHKLLRADLIELVYLPSPYPNSKTPKICHLKATAAKP